MTLVDILNWAWSVGVPVVILMLILEAFWHRRVYTAGAVVDMLKAKDDKYNEMKANLTGQVKDLKSQNDRTFEKVVIPALAVSKSALDKVSETAKT